MENTYYDGTKLLSLLDINGEKPEIFISTSNRSAGKTTYFNRLAVNRFKKTGSKFAILYRFDHELMDCAEKFFKDIGELFFWEDEMESVSRANGAYQELKLNHKPCGYALSINSADKIKKLSHLLSDIDLIIFDEFQSETNHYCTNEVKKFISLHTSIARGQGKQVRYVPTIMIGNPITLLNPYYLELGISERLREDTKYLKGDGFVLEQGFVESASLAQKGSAFNRAFNRNNYVAYASQAIYLNDSKSFIEKPEGNSHYLCTLKYMGYEYAIREFSELGIIFIDDKPDKSFKYKISVTTDDHEINYVMLKTNDFFLANIKRYFELGCLRFKNMKCKEALLKSLNY